MKRPKRFFKLAGSLGALALCLGSVGCTGNKHCRTDAECAEIDAKRDEGRRLVSQVGCNKCSTPGCKGGAGCGGHREPPHKCPDPPDPIKLPCAANGSITVGGDETSYTLERTIDGSVPFTDRIVRCSDGTVVGIGQGTLPVKGGTTLVITAKTPETKVPLVIEAKPNDPPCPPKSP